jgi:hypothetical protein
MDRSFRIFMCDGLTISQVSQLARPTRQLECIKLAPDTP